MTLGDGKRKVLLLMDEYSSGGTPTPDADIDEKMNDFFDLAQKNVARYQRIVRQYKPVLPAGAAGKTQSMKMPADFGELFRVWRDGKLYGGYQWRGNSILLPTEDVSLVEVEYFATPKAIPAGAPPSYEFEVSEDAAACLPYFVAAQQLIVDLVVDYGALLNLYDRMLGALSTKLPSAGGGGIRQSMYR
ncbi:MAG: hypothetical protein RSB55_08010 [Oscillospiraceae bacterium]